jgi:hypothetical protein
MPTPGQKTGQFLRDDLVIADVLTILAGRYAEPEGASS